MDKVAPIPGYATKQAEDRKFLADMTSNQPISALRGGPHILIPFAIEDGGRLDAYAQALLRALATTTLTKERLPPFAKVTEDPPDVSIPVGQEVATTHLSMATYSHLPS